MGHSAPLLEGSEISVHRRPVSMTSFQLASSIQMLRVICTGVRDLLVLQTLLLVLRTGAFSLRRSASPNGSLHPPPLCFTTLDTNASISPPLVPLDPLDSLGRAADEQ